MGSSAIVETPAPVHPHAPATSARACDRILAFVDAHRRWFFAGLILLYVAGFNGFWRIEPDGALYLSLAKNIAEGKGYLYLNRAHHLAYPGLPYLIAGTFKLFGPGAIWPIHVLIGLMSLATLALVYRLICLHADRATASVVTFITGGTYLFLSFAYQLRNDVPYALGVMAFLCGCEGLRTRSRRRVLDIALIVSGTALATVMRPAMWALLFTIVLGTIFWMLQKRRGWALLLGAAGVVTAVAFLCMYQGMHVAGLRILGDYEEQSVEKMTGSLGQMLWQVAGVNVPRLLGPILAESMCGHELGPVLNPLAGLAVLVSACVYLRARPMWLVFVFMNLLMMLLVLPEEAILPRYILPIFPLLVFAVWRGIASLNRRLPQPWDWAGVILLCLWLIPNGIKDGEIIREQHAADFYATYKHGRYPPMFVMAEQLREIVPPTRYVLAETKSGRIMSYLSDRRVVDSWEVPRFKPGKKIFLLLPADAGLVIYLRDKRVFVDDPPLTRVKTSDPAVSMTLHTALVGGRTELP